MLTVMTSQKIVDAIYARLTSDIYNLSQLLIKPTLAVILVGDDSSSVTFVSIKQKQAEELGVGFKLHHLAPDSEEATVFNIIEELNNDPKVTGIIIQLPLPNHLNTDRTLQAVAREKDVDGLRADSPYTPPTVQAVLTLLREYNINLFGKKIVVVGKGRLVGGPLLAEFQKQRLHIAACDESTADLQACTVGADILISATGQERLIKPGMIKDGAVVIDVEREVDYEQVLDKVSYITPQKGGIGPLTVAFLLSNVVKAAKSKVAHES